MNFKHLTPSISDKIKLLPTVGCKQVDHTKFKTNTISFRDNKTILQTN